MDFTLSNARRFYSSMGNILDGKGLKTSTMLLSLFLWTWMFFARKQNLYLDVSTLVEISMNVILKNSCYWLLRHWRNHFQLGHRRERNKKLRARDLHAPQWIEVRPAWVEKEHRRWAKIPTLGFFKTILEKEMALGSSLQYFEKKKKRVCHSIWLMVSFCHIFFLLCSYLLSISLKASFMFRIMMFTYCFHLIDWLFLKLCFFRRRRLMPRNIPSCKTAARSGHGKAFWKRPWRSGSWFLWVYVMSHWHASEVGRQVGRGRALE